MMLKNETETDLFVTYVNGHTSRIGPGDVRKELFDVECITIVADGVSYEFRPVWPPQEYVETGMFSSKVDAVFTEDQELILVQPEAQSVALELERGCN